MGGTGVGPFPPPTFLSYTPNEDCPALSREIRGYGRAPTIQEPDVRAPGYRRMTTERERHSPARKDRKAGRVSAMSASVRTLLPAPSIVVKQKRRRYVCHQLAHRLIMSFMRKHRLCGRTTKSKTERPWSDANKRRGVGTLTRLFRFA